MRKPLLSDDPPDAEALSSFVPLIFYFFRSAGGRISMGVIFGLESQLRGKYGLSNMPE